MICQFQCRPMACESLLFLSLPPLHLILASFLPLPPSFSLSFILSSLLSLAPSLSPYLLLSPSPLLHFSPSLFLLPLYSLLFLLVVGSDYCLVVSFPFPVCWSYGMHCLPMAPPSTWWTTSVWPCLCTSEKSVCTPYTYMTGRNHLGFQLATYAC